jgi:hypothetical protein
MGKDRDELADLQGLGTGRGRGDTSVEDSVPNGEEPEEPAGIPAKLALTLFPFVVVLLFLILEWWIRGRS